MSDQKTIFTEDLIEKLSTRFSTDDLQYIREAVTKVLGEYEVSERCTAVAIRDDKNERLIKRYAACMSVDGKSQRTISLYVRRLQVFSEFIGKPFDEVGTYDVRFYLASMKENGVSNRTLENYRSYIASFYQWMTREDFIPKNPCDKIQPIKYKDEVKHPFSETEIDALRGACKDERERAMVEVLISSGVRVEELVNINIFDADLNRLSLHVREGKGSKERVTYITEVCALHLKMYLATRADTDTALFASVKRKERITTSGIRKILKTIGERAGVTDVHPHRFRRTFATNLSKRGMDIQTIAKLMGHSNIQTTMVYVSMDESRIVEEYRKHTA